MRPQNLSHKVRGIIANRGRYEEVLLSAISLWEFCKLVQTKRLGISCSARVWLEEALDMPALRLVPLSPSIAYHSTTLPQPLSFDPADEIIVATAREENAIILTKDGAMRDYEHVRTLW